MENGGAVVERARPLSVGGQEPAQPAACASGPRGGAVRARGSHAIVKRPDYCLSRERRPLGASRPDWARGGRAAGREMQAVSRRQ